LRSVFQALIFPLGNDARARLFASNTCSPRYSVDLAFARFKSEEIIEISTGTGGLNPRITNYYFVIGPHTHQVLPKKLFNGADGLTNQISSALLLNGATEPLKIMRGNTLAPNFIVYRDNGSRISRKVLRWNGNVYR
jgi:hypothetical protein